MILFINRLTTILLFSLWFTPGGTAQKYSPLEINWCQTYLLDTSPDGSWVYYGNFFMDESSKGIVKSHNEAKSYIYPQASGGKFSSNSKWFTIPLNSDTLVLQDLKNGTKQFIPKVKQHYFSHSGDYLIFQSIHDSLSIRNLQNKEVFKVGSNKGFKLNPKIDAVAMIEGSNQHQTLQIVDLDTSSTSVIMEEDDASFSRIAWSPDGQKLAFIYSNNNGKIYKIGLHDTKNKTTRLLDWDSHYAESLAITNTQISVANAGEKVYFQVIPISQPPVESLPEVWDTFDQIIYPRKSFVNSGKQGPWQWVWLSTENRVVPLGDNEMPHTLFNPESEYALAFDAYAREPQFRYDTFVDLYAVDVKSGKRELIISNQYTALNYVHLSPDGNFLVYFRNNNWWNYDFKEGKHFNLTSTIQNISFLSDLTDPYGMAGWSQDGKSLYLYDKYDVWKVDSHGKYIRKMTNGRETNRVYRIVNDYKNTVYRDLGFNASIVADVSEVLLTARDRYNLDMGYFTWKDNKMHQIIWCSNRLKDLIKIKDGIFLFSQQSLTEPTSIEYLNLNNKESHTIFKSNPDWKQYKWPQRELIHYNTKTADSLKGVLIYPLDYNSAKKYPMVVSTYTKQSFLYHEFSPPYYFNEIGFDYLTYALDGYFVLLPDIHYEPDAPGISAATCIEKAVKTTIENASIDSNKIGLIGHSQGGFDTAFTITQTDLFAAAVAGSGIFNFESFYFDIYKLGGLPEISRIENNLFNMQSSFFENPHAYRANSPLHQATKINTPFLIWTGKADTNVNPNQSLQMYLALRRLRKPAKLIYYEGENHVLNQIENRKDLTNRIKEWFDRYLK